MRYVYLVIIDESSGSGQVTEARKAQRGSWAAPPLPLPPFTYDATCVGCVCVPDPRCSPNDPTSTTCRSPMPAVLAPLRVPGSSTLPVAHSAKRIPSQRGASARTAQRVPLEHRLVHQPIGRAAL